MFWNALPEGMCWNGASWKVHRAESEFLHTFTQQHNR